MSVISSVVLPVIVIVSIPLPATCSTLLSSERYARSLVFLLALNALGFAIVLISILVASGIHDGSESRVGR